MKAGELNLITDVPGLTVGHATDARAATGVTVLLGERPLAAGVDVRGGAPGVRETDTLAPDALVGHAHAIVLSGGSVFGLGAADGVAAELSRRGTGLRLLAHTRAIPIVPAAVLHDLGEGDKDWSEPPYRALGVAALCAAQRRFALGRIGAGCGARAGRVPGGVGSASLDLGDGLVVGALVAVNSIGSVYYPDGRTPYAWPYELDGEFGGHRPGAEQAPLIDPAPPESRLGELGGPAAGSSTVIGVVAVSADLTGAECRRLAVMAHDGIARAVRPSHTPFDGDTLFAVASGARPLAAASRPAQLARLGAAAADCMARAIARGAFE
ncbi:MAG: P1 family peptidase, partial [Proteobacteria bacterium]|nr:P1 family peptidase [Pseudomonadota bacterium]